MLQTAITPNLSGHFIRRGLDFRKRVRWKLVNKLCLMGKNMPALVLSARDAREPMPSFRED